MALRMQRQVTGLGWSSPGCLVMLPPQTPPPPHPFLPPPAVPYMYPDKAVFHAVGVPEAVQAMALRMQTQLWRVTGRGWAGLLAGLTGFANAHPHPTPLLRVARAACVRDVCRHDSGKGVELVRAIQAR